MMKICEVVYNWPAETFIQRHVKALQSLSSPVKVVARHTPDMQIEIASLGENVDGINVQIMPNFNHLNSIEKLVSLRYLSVKCPRVSSISEKVLLGYFDRLRPDLIHFHDATLAASMCWIPNELRIPYTLSIRGSDVQVIPLQSPDKKEGIVSAIEGAANVHIVCQDLARQASELLEHEFRYSVIYTTVPIPASLPAWEPPVAGGDIRFVSSGRLMWRKGFNNLLLALRHLRDRSMDARLTLIGVGPDLDHLLYMRNTLDLNEYVEFPGKLGYEQMRKIFMNSHAYIQSSVTEGLSNSMAEAMANGLPVFATDVSGTREVIEDGITGFLLEPYAQQDWAEKLLLVRDGALMERIRVSAYQRARQLFSAERHARAFASFFDGVLRQNS